MASAQRKLSTYNSEDMTTASRLVDNMVAAVPFEKRHAWLLDHGWQFAGYNAPMKPDLFDSLGDIISSYRAQHGRANYRNPKIDHPRLRNGGTCNQTFAMHVAAWDILEKKGIVYRPTRFRTVIAE